MDDRKAYSEWMLITLVVWLCITPLLLFIVVPSWGTWFGASSVGLLLVFLLSLCWIVCLRPHK